MARYSYSGPAQTIPIATGQAKAEDGSPVSTFDDVALIPGQVVELPETNALVASMSARGWLTPVADAPTKTSGKTKPEPEKEAK